METDPQHLQPQWAETHLITMKINEEHYGINIRR